jgi:predicted DNA-binding protein
MAQPSPVKEDEQELDTQLVVRVNSKFRERFQAFAAEAERTEAQEVRRALRRHLEAGQL